MTNYQDVFEDIVRYRKQGNTNSPNITSSISNFIDSEYAANNILHLVNKNLKDSRIVSGENYSALGSANNREVSSFGPIEFQRRASDSDDKLEVDVASNGQRNDFEARFNRAFDKLSKIFARSTSHCTEEAFEVFVKSTGVERHSPEGLSKLLKLDELVRNRKSGLIREMLRELELIRRLGIRFSQRIQPLDELNIFEEENMEKMMLTKLVNCSLSFPASALPEDNSFIAPMRKARVQKPAEESFHNFKFSKTS